MNMHVMISYTQRVPKDPFKYDTAIPTDWIEYHEDVLLTATRGQIKHYVRELQNHDAYDIEVYEDPDDCGEYYVYVDFDDVKESKPTFVEFLRRFYHMSIDDYIDFLDDGQKKAVESEYHIRYH